MGMFGNSLAALTRGFGSMAGSKPAAPAGGAGKPWGNWGFGGGKTASGGTFAGVSAEDSPGTMATGGMGATGATGGAPWVSPETNAQTTAQALGFPSTDATTIGGGTQPGGGAAPPNPANGGAGSPLAGGAWWKNLGFGGGAMQGGMSAVNAAQDMQHHDAPQYPTVNNRTGGVAPGANGSRYPAGFSYSQTQNAKMAHHQQATQASLQALNANPEAALADGQAMINFQLSDMANLTPQAKTAVLAWKRAQTDGEIARWQNMLSSGDYVDPKNLVGINEAIRGLNADYDRWATA